MTKIYVPVKTVDRSEEFQSEAVKRKFTDGERDKQQTAIGRQQQQHQQQFKTNHIKQ